VPIGSALPLSPALEAAEDGPGIAAPAPDIDAGANPLGTDAAAALPALGGRITVRSSSSAGVFIG
jgi:hypothetical protein